MLTILILALLTLPFLPFILFDARRRKAMERRAAFDSPDCGEAIRAMFLHLAAYLDRCGKGVGNRPLLPMGRCAGPNRFSGIRRAVPSCRRAF
ncbi:MAG: hypothetical protein ACLU38_08420 [Dysosmobacter sp.]